MRIKPLLLSVVLALAGCSPSDSGSFLKENAESNDSEDGENDLKTEIVVVEDHGEKIPVLLTGTGLKQSGYKLECDEDILGLKKLIEAVGFPYELLDIRTPLNPRNPKVASSGYKTNPSINCNAKENYNASLIKIPQDESTKYFVTYGNLESGKQVFHMVGCKALLGAMGFKLNEAVEMSPAAANIMANKSDKFDISCISGVPVDYVGVTMVVSPLGQTVVKGGEIKPVELKLENYEGVDSPLFSLYENQCEGLNITGAKLTGIISPDISAQSCTAQILGSADGKSYGPVAVEFFLQEREEDKAIITGERTQIVQAKTRISPVLISAKRSALSLDVKNKLRPESDDCSWVRFNDGKLTGVAPVTIDGYTCSVAVLLNGVATGQEIDIGVAPYLLDASEYDRVANNRSSKGFCAGQWIYKEYEQCNDSATVYKYCGSFQPHTCHGMKFDSKYKTIRGIVNVPEMPLDIGESVTEKLEWECRKRYKESADYAEGYEYIKSLEVVDREHNPPGVGGVGDYYVRFKCDVLAEKTINHYNAICDYKEAKYCAEQEQKLKFCNKTKEKHYRVYNIEKSKFQPNKLETNVYITTIKESNSSKVHDAYSNFQEKCEAKAREMGFPGTAIRYKNVNSWVSECQARGALGRCIAKTYYKAWECYGDYDRVVNDDYICSNGDHLPQHSADDVNRKFEFIKSAFIKAETEDDSLERENKIRTLMMSLEGVAGSRYSNEAIVEYFKDKLKYEPAIRFPELANPFDSTMDIIGFSTDNFGRPMANLRWKRTSASSNEWKIIGQNPHDIQKLGFSLYGVDSGLVKESDSTRNGYLEMNPYSDYEYEKEVLYYEGIAKSDHVEFLVEYELENSAEDYDRILESLSGVVFFREEERGLARSVKISGNTYVIKGRANVEKGELVSFGLYGLSGLEKSYNPSSLKIKRAFLRNVACNSFNQYFYPEFCHKAENPEFLMDAPASGQSVPKISLSKSQIDFGTKGVWGFKPYEKNLEISNTGSANLIIDKIWAEESQFFVEGVDFPLVIEPEKSTIIKVYYFPVKQKEVTTVLGIKSNTQDKYVYLSLRGRAIDGGGLDILLGVYSDMKEVLKNEISSCSNTENCEKTERFCRAQYEAGIAIVTTMETNEYEEYCNEYLEMVAELNSIIDKDQCNNPKGYFDSENKYNGVAKLKLEAYKSFLTGGFTCPSSR